MVLDLYKLPQTVFTLKELSLLFPNLNTSLIRRRAHYYVQTGQLLRPRPGVFTKPVFEPFELANKIYSPSYISFETVLQKEGIIFQPYTTIFLASYLSRIIKVSGLTFHYRKIKSDILLDSTGIITEKNYSIASKERAFLDTVFLDKDRYFDHLDSIDWKIASQLVKKYASKSLAKRLKSYAQSNYS